MSFDELVTELTFDRTFNNREKRIRPVGRLKRNKFTERIGHVEITECRRKYSLKEQNKLHSQNAGGNAIEMKKICHIYRFQKERIFERR
jgi:hypothetical protein